MKKYLSVLSLCCILLISLSSCTFEPEDTVPQTLSSEQLEESTKSDPFKEELDPPFEENLEYIKDRKFDMPPAVTKELLTVGTLIDPDEKDQEDDPNVLSDHVTNNRPINLIKTN